MWASSCVGGGNQTKAALDSYDLKATTTNIDIANRMAQNVRAGKFAQADVDAAERIAVSGGKTAREVAEQQMIDDFKGVDNLLNQRNPIGPKRFDLMPNQPYTRGQ